MKYTSSHLKALLKYYEQTQYSDVSFESVISMLGTNSFALILIFFSLPAALPFSMIPGVSFVFSIPIVFVAFQMIIGCQQLWLPQKINNNTISKDKLIKIINHSVPYLEKIESILKPRFFLPHQQLVITFLGFVILLVSILLMLPIPFSNFIFSSIIIFLSLSWMEKDGLCMLITTLLLSVYLFFLYWIFFNVIHHLLFNG